MSKMKSTKRWNHVKEPFPTIKKLACLLQQTSPLRGQDLNLRPRGYEPRKLPDCSTPRSVTMNDWESLSS